MKRFFKISGIVLAILATILIACMAALMSPAVQNALTRAILNSIENKIDGKFQFSSITIRPLDAIVVEDFVLIDNSPYTDPELPHLARIDTVARAKNLSVTFDVFGLISGKPAIIKDLRVKDGEFSLVNEPGGNNLKRIFTGNKKKPKKPRNIPDKEFARIDYVNIDGFRYRMINYRRPKPHRDRAINWTDFDFKDIHLTARNFSVVGTVIEGDLEHLEGKEKSGYAINHVGGHVKVASKQTTIENLVVRDLWSDVRMKVFKMHYEEGIRSLNRFIQEVRLTGDLERSRINFKTIAYMAPSLHKMDVVSILEDGLVDGYINDLHFKNLHISSPEGDFRGTFNGAMVGLPSIMATKMDFYLTNLDCTSESLAKIVKGVVPNIPIDFSKYAKGERFNIDCSMNGLLNQTVIKSKIRARRGGSLASTLRFGHLLEGSSRPITIAGRADSKDFDLGKITGIKELGPCTMRAGFKTTLGKKKLSVGIDSLRVDRLRAMDYDYSDFVASGTYSGDAFNGIIFCNDPNLNFAFSGLFSLSGKTGSRAYDFKANLAYANLNALHIDKRGKSELKFSTKANFKTLPGGDILGIINIKNVVLTDEDGDNDIGDITINSYMKGDVNNIKLDSKFLSARYSGTRFLGGFIEDMKTLTAGENLPSLLAKQPETWNGDRYSLDFKIQDANMLADFVIPGAYIAAGTTGAIEITREGMMIGDIKSQRLAIGDRYIKDMNLRLDNSAGHIEGDLYAGEMRFAPLKALDNRLRVVAGNDNVGILYSYNNDAEGANKGDISAGIEFARGADGLSLQATLLPSQITMNSDGWHLESTPVQLSSKGLKLEKLLAISSDQSLRIEGGWSSFATDTLRLTLRDFDLDAVNPFLAHGMELGGKATGTALVISPSSGMPSILANLTIIKTTFGDEDMGTFKFASSWNEARQGYRIIAQNTLEDGSKPMAMRGFLSPSDKAFRADFNFDKFNVGGFGTMIESLLSEMKGQVSGQVKADGHFGRDMNFHSDSLALTDGLLRIAFTNVPYSVEGKMSVHGNAVHFDDVSVKDSSGENGRITGSIGWKNRGDFDMGLKIDINNMQVLNMEENVNPTFYGDIRATGTATLSGPLSDLLFKVNARTTGDGELHIPMNSTGGMSRTDLLVFKEPEPEVAPDPYEEMMKARKAKEKKDVRFKMDMSVEAHEGVTGFIEVDKTAGNMFSGNGHGNIQMKMDMSKGDMSFGGNYSISSGVYHFAALGIAKRDFKVQEGSNVKFAGGIMETALDIKALYNTKTSLATLLSDTLSTSSRHLVECGIGISGKLKAPRIQFTIDVPDIDPTTKARVESALNTEDKIQKQFLSLLISGGFLPDDPSGVVNNSSMLGATVADMMASQLSNVLQKLNIPIDLGLDYQQTTSGADIFEVAVSTQLFNNRVSINGTFGNRQRSTTSSQDVVGDIDVEFKLTKNGNIRATAFHHTADQYTNYLDNLKRSGLGMSLQTEFDTAGELLRNLFPWMYKKTEANKEAIIEEKEKTVIIIEADE